MLVIFFMGFVFFSITALLWIWICAFASFYGFLHFVFLKSCVLIDRVLWVVYVIVVVAQEHPPLIS